MVNKELKVLRCLKSLNQADIAKALNITTASYNRKENGKQPFLLHEAKIISNLFNKSIEEIFFADAFNKRQNKNSL
jgi:putative transcriptional regulator